jgi:hypothetical protein
MRTFFFVVAGAGLVMIALGMFSATPILPGTAGRTLDEWYTAGMLWGAVTGMVLGAGSAWLTERRLQHKPRESGIQFNGRVAMVAFWTLVGVFFAAVIVSMLRAAGAVFIPLDPLSRVLSLLGNARFLSIAGISIVTGAIAFTAVARVRNWGGRYALLSLRKS